MKKLIHVLDKDKRKRKRVELFCNIPTTIEGLGRSVAAKIKDVSYSGFGLVLSSSSYHKMINSLEIKLQLADQLFQGTVANTINLSDEQIKIGIKLPSQTHRDIDFNTQDSSWDRVTDQETIINIFNDLVFKGPLAPIEIRQNFSKATLHPIELTKSETIICEIVEIHQGVFEKGKAKCVFDLFQTCHAFDTNVERLDEKRIELKLSSTLARLLRRQTVRVLKKQNEYEVKVKLKSENLNQEISEFEVYDYSEQGLSLKDPDGDLSLPRNLSFNEVSIEIKNIGCIRGKGQVRSYEWKEEQDSYIIGLLFEPDPEPHLTNWHNFILKARYPNLDFIYKDEDHQKIWDLFDISGYLKKKNDSKQEFVINKTKKTWFDLNLAGTEFSKRIMLKDKDEIVGHMQIDKIYPRTWCVHHLAINPKVSKMVAKDLYSVTTDVLLSENAKYLLNFTDVNKPWNQRSYYDFIQNYRFKEHNELKTFQVYLNENFVFKKSDKFTIRDASKYDLKKIVKFFEAHLSQLEIDACALNEKEILLSELEGLYNKFNLKRSRKFVVLYSFDNEFLGFSRIEVGDEGVNIFNSLNMFYVYSLIEDPRKQDVINQLIIESLEFYKKENIQDVLITLDDNNIEYYVKNGLKLFSDAVRWLALKDILPRYHAFCQLLYGHLVLKREKVRQNIKNNDE